MMAGDLALRTKLMATNGLLDRNMCSIEDPHRPNLYGVMQPAKKNAARCRLLKLTSTAQLHDFARSVPKNKPVRLQIGPTARDTQVLYSLKVAADAKIIIEEKKAAADIARASAALLKAEAARARAEKAAKSRPEAELRQEANDAAKARTLEANAKMAELKLAKATSSTVNQSVRRLSSCASDEPDEDTRYAIELHYMSPGAAKASGLSLTIRSLDPSGVAHGGGAANCFLEPLLRLSELNQVARMHHDSSAHGDLPPHIPLSFMRLARNQKHAVQLDRMSAINCDDDLSASHYVASAERPDLRVLPIVLIVAAKPKHAGTVGSGGLCTKTSWQGHIGGSTLAGMMPPQSFAAAAPNLALIGEVSARLSTVWGLAYEPNTQKIIQTQSFLTATVERAQTFLAHSDKLFALPELRPAFSDGVMPRPKGAPPTDALVLPTCAPAPSTGALAPPASALQPAHACTHASACCAPAHILHDMRLPYVLPPSRQDSPRQCRPRLCHSYRLPVVPVSQHSSPARRRSTSQLICAADAPAPHRSPRRSRAHRDGRAGVGLVAHAKRADRAAAAGGLACRR
jgi:hypothetical protein